MKKRCIWNWYRKRKIEYLDEEDRWFKYLEMLVIGIFIVIGVVGPIAVLGVFAWQGWQDMIKDQMTFQNTMILEGFKFIVLLPVLIFFEYIIYAQVYDSITSFGVYYLNERGIQLEYCMHICREIR